jgi:ketol-acid reductoisomerase
MSEPSPAFRAFGTSDGDIKLLATRSIAFIGYGNQGRAQALNLRDSLSSNSLSPSVIVGTEQDETWQQAESDEFAVHSVAEAAQASDILFLLVPDEVLPDVFYKQIRPNLEEHDVLVFASGYNLTYESISLPDNIDVSLLAPRMIGRQVRELYERDQGFYSYVSVEQDASGSAWETLLALASGIGTLAPPGGAFELPATVETLLDLYHEQGFGSLLGMMFYTMLEVGIEAGIPAEAMALDLYLSGEAAETLQAMADVGFYEQSKLHSRTSQYGGMMRSLALDREPMRQHLAMVAQEVKDGSFAKRWAEEQASGAKNFEQLRELAGKANPFTPIEERIKELIREAQSRGT